MNGGLLFQRHKKTILQAMLVQLLLGWEEMAKNVSWTGQLVNGLLLLRPRERDTVTSVSIAFKSAPSMNNVAKPVLAWKANKAFCPLIIEGLRDRWLDCFNMQITSDLGQLAPLETTAIRDLFACFGYVSILAFLKN